MKMLIFPPVTRKTDSDSKNWLGLKISSRQVSDLLEGLFLKSRSMHGPKGVARKKLPQWKRLQWLSYFPSLHFFRYMSSFSQRGQRRTFSSRVCWVGMPISSVVSCLAGPKYWDRASSSFIAYSGKARVRLLVCILKWHTLHTDLFASFNKHCFVVLNLFGKNHWKKTRNERRNKQWVLTIRRTKWKCWNGSPEAKNVMQYAKDGFSYFARAALDVQKCRESDQQQGVPQKSEHLQI